MSDAERVVKHLEMIQGSIQRMAGNSFRLRGWSVVLVAGWLVSLARAEAEGSSPVSESALSRYLVLIPFLLMFALDGYHLWQERLFRRLYDEVRRANSTDFSMDTSFGEDFSQRVSGYIASCFPSRSRPVSTPFLFHGAIIALLIVVESPVA